MASKKHNWPGASKVADASRSHVDEEVDTAMMHLICGCSHLTPANEAKLDNLITKNFGKDKEAGLTRRKADEAVLAALNAEDDDDWESMKGPTRQDLKNDEAENSRVMHNA